MAYYLKMGIAGALLGAGLASLVMIPVRLYSIRELLVRRFSTVFLKKLLLFGLPLVPVELAYWLFSNADRIMLIKMVSLKAAGVYAIAVSMAAVLSLLHNAVGQSWLSLIHISTPFCIFWRKNRGWALTARLTSGISPDGWRA